MMIQAKPGGPLTATVRESRELSAIRLVRSSVVAKSATRWLGTLLVLTSVGLLVLPWQQNIRGTGQVVAYSPLSRPLEVQALIEGRIDRWEPNINENVEVQAGQPILHIQDIDPEYEQRLLDGVELAEEQVRQARHVVEAMEESLQIARYYQAQLLESADQIIRSAELDLEAEKQNVEAAVSDYETKRLIKDADEELFKNGQITAGLELQKARNEFRFAETKLAAAEFKRDSAQAKLRDANIKKEATRQDTDAKIQEAQSKINKEFSTLQSYEKEVLYAKRDLARYQQGKLVTAPRDGRIFKVFRNQGNDFVKKGDPLFALIPNTDERSVELFVDGNDYPLLSEGNPVRLQFEGYPAVQFTPGWPEAAMGTFGGLISIIDSTSQVDGTFRIVVVADPNDTPWPDARWTRQGIRANGWVLLSRVPVWYELWRQLNGFPPIIKDEASKKTGSEKSKPPLPK